MMSLLRYLFTLLALLVFNFSISQNIDIDILRSVNVGRDKALDPPARVISSAVTPVTITVPVLIYTIGLVKKDSIYKRKGVFLASAATLAACVTTGLKYTINRTRPYVKYPFIEKVGVEHSPSFPSGHTSAAFSTATSLSLAYPKWYVIVPSFSWACAVGYSRMHLGVHYPSDVLAGAIVASGCAILCHYVNKRIGHKK